MSTAPKSPSRHVWYDAVRLLLRVGTIAMFRLRCYDRHRLPGMGGALIVTNHQSNLDPVLIGLVCNRPLNTLARATLFRPAPVRWLLRSVKAIAMDREGPAVGGLKETLKRLRRQELVLVFPEGTRSRRGEISRLKPGFCVLARRGRVPIVPAALAGAFEAWPRFRRFPRGGTVVLQFARPIPAATIAGWSDEQLVREVERRLHEAYAQARWHRDRARRGAP